MVWPPFGRFMIRPCRKTFPENDAEKWPRGQNEEFPGYSMEWVSCLYQSLQVRSISTGNHHPSPFGPLRAFESEIVRWSVSSWFSHTYDGSKWMLHRMWMKRSFQMDAWPNGSSALMDHKAAAVFRKSLQSAPKNVRSVRLDQWQVNDLLLPLCVKEFYAESFCLSVPCMFPLTLPGIHSDEWCQWLTASQVISSCSKMKKKVEAQ